MTGAALFFAVALAATGCDKIANLTGQDNRPPTNTKGAPMEPTPTTRQQAQDAVYRYYQKTLQELPDGYALDNSAFGGAGATVTPCSDYGTENNDKDPAKYHDSRFVIAPPGTNNLDLVAKVGNIWRKWGWRVEARKGFNDPNYFGIAPDGYMLKAEVADDDPLKYPVVFTGSSPCFTGDKTRFEPIPEALKITRDGFQYSQSSTTPTR